jgi:hypothetical protein
MLVKLFPFDEKLLEGYDNIDFDRCNCSCYYDWLQCVETELFEVS